MLHSSLSQQAQALADKSISSVELTQSYLDRIDAIDPKLNSFITVNGEQALKQAANADKLRQQGQSNPLLGIPIAHKDIFCTQGVKTSCASKMLDNFIAPYNATVIEKFNNQGAVLLGKTNMDEFAMGSSSESSFYGPTLNPWSEQHVPGGSSGGSAAAVAAGLCSAATGTDTGGSIRQPAAYCGLTGLKPTYGRVSRWGMIAYASSLDQGGPLTRSAEDAAIMLQAMAGFDEKDSTSVQHPVADYQAELSKPLNGLKIGIARDYFNQSLNPELAASIEQAAQLLQSLGATLQDVALPNTDAGIPAYYIIAPAEASTNLSRYDGVRFGYRCDNPKNLDDLYLRSRSEGFGDEVKRRIMVGTYALSAGFYDAYYRKAQKIRRLIKQDFVSAFNQVDVILSPITANTAFKLGEKSADPVSMYKEDIYSIIANLAGIPALSLPIGQLNNLPVSMQLMGNYFDEARLLNIGHAFQQNSEFHLARPEV